MKKFLFIFTVLFTLTACNVPDFYYPTIKAEKYFKISNSNIYCLQQCFKKFGKIRVSGSILSRFYLHRPMDKFSCLCPILIDVEVESK